LAFDTNGGGRTAVFGAGNASIDGIDTAFMFEWFAKFCKFPTVGWFCAPLVGGGGGIPISERAPIAGVGVRISGIGGSNGFP